MRYNQQKYGALDPDLLLFMKLGIAFAIVAFLVVYSLRKR